MLIMIIILILDRQLCGSLHNKHNSQHWNITGKSTDEILREKNWLPQVSLIDLLNYLIHGVCAKWDRTQV